MAFFRYSLTGAAATALHYAVLLVLVELLGAPVALAAGAGAVCGAGLAYVANRRLAFRDTSAPHQQALPRFFAVALAGVAMNSLIVWAGTHAFAWHYLAAQALATVVVLALGFQINRSWTFA